jgi:hypothetical protein
MDELRQHEIFRHRREAAKIVGLGRRGDGHVEPHQPISLGAAILLLADLEEPAGASVAFGDGETLSQEECVALKRHYKDELLLDDAAHGDGERLTDMDRAPGSGTGQGS